MRLDKYLKVSRLIKRRTVANEACDAGRVLINGNIAKAGTNVKVGDQITIQLAKRALIRLQSSNRIAWIVEGYQGHLNNLIVRSEEDRKQFIAEGKLEQADLMIKSPDVLDGVTSRHAMLLLNVGIRNIGILREVMWMRSGILCQL